MGRFVTRDSEGFERIVYAEVLIPGRVNSHGDLHTRDSVKSFAYGFMLNGFGIDINHDENDVSGQVTVVESFIAREDDPDFIEGSWVVGLHIEDDEVWDKVKRGELNGFSYQALVRMLETDAIVEQGEYIVGETEPDLNDGHVHEFFAFVGPDGRVIRGGTTSADGHTHIISRHTYTEEADNHIHRFNMVV